MNKFTLLLITLLIGIASITTASALNLQQAKSQGLVGEQPNGYLSSVVPNPSAALNALIARINQTRKQRYQQIAKNNNISLSDVEMIAGKEAFARTKKSNYVFARGKWQKNSSAA